MANLVIAQELNLRQELQQKGAQIESDLIRVNEYLRVSQEESKLIQTCLLGSQSTATTLRTEMDQQHMQHNFENQKLVLELQAEHANRPMMNSSAQQMMHRLQGSESQAAELRTSLQAVEHASMREVRLEQVKHQHYVWNANQSHQLQGEEIYARQQGLDIARHNSERLQQQLLQQQHEYVQEVASSRLLREALSRSEAIAIESQHEHREAVEGLSSSHRDLLEEQLAYQQTLSDYNVLWNEYEQFQSEPLPTPPGLAPQQHVPTGTAVPQTLVLKNLPEQKDTYLPRLLQKTTFRRSKKLIKFMCLLIRISTPFRVGKRLYCRTWLLPQDIVIYKAWWLG